MNAVNDKNKLVCIFDSGIGGLHLLAECVKRGKISDLVYLSDNGNVPYGGRGHDEILRLAVKNFDKIALCEPDCAVAACNTVTAECIEALRGRYAFPIVGVQPAIKPAAIRGGKCLVLATPATANSPSVRAIAERYGGEDVDIVACPDLAAYIENNLFNLTYGGVAERLPARKPDSVVLGCTHYAYVSKFISEFYACPVFDGTEGTANRIEKILGIFDHFSKSPPNVLFLGGNRSKNSRILNLLLSL